MNKIVHATSRGQITLPKKWRERFDTEYFVMEIEENELVLRPLPKEKTFKDKVEDSWEEYKQGEFVEGAELMEKYGL